MSGTSSLSSTTYFVELNRSLSPANKKIYTIKLYSINASGTTTALTKTIDVTGFINDDFKNEPQDPLYDAKLAQFINIKFVNKTNSTSITNSSSPTSQHIIYVNKHRISIDRLNNTLNSKFSIPYFFTASHNAGQPLFSCIFRLC